MSAAPSVLAVGTVAFDTIETPFGRADRVLGGSATYLTLAARFLTDAVRLVGVVGRDFPEEHVALLQDRGVDTEGLVRDEEGETFFWAGRYGYDLNTRDTLATHLNVLATFQPEIPDAYADSRIVCLGNLDPGVQAAVLDQVEAAGPRPDLVVLDTMNYWIEHTPKALRQVLRRVDVLVINDSEARELANEPNLVRAARIIREMGPPVLVIKKGEHGALLFSDGAVFSAPAYPLEDIHDPTGAGDTFLGGFAGHLARTDVRDPEELRRAVVLGSALASFVVEAFGPERLLSLTPEELEARIGAFHDLVAIPSGIAVAAG
ncbi:MAG: PfkB family carbohydrate kinase [Rhodothermales bacterium]|nr:PfkB family carbohydrate kinase [Rhodothermales bacterium]